MEALKRTLVLPAVIVCLAVCLQTGCNSSTGPANPDAEWTCFHEDRELVDFDELLLIRQRENLAENQRTLVLGCFTRPYGSPCYVIPYCLQRVGEAITIKFNGVGLPAPWMVCPGVRSPAHSDVELGELPNGEYSLSLSISDTLLQSSLVVSDDSYQVDWDQNSFVDFRNPESRRIPENTIWGLIRCSEEVVVASYLDSLQIIGADPVQLAPGFYHYGHAIYDPPIDYVGCLEIDEAGAIHMDPQDPSERPYIFRFEGDMNLIKDLIARYGTRYGGSTLFIEVHGTHGEYFTC